MKKYIGAEENQLRVIKQEYLERRYRLYSVNKNRIKALFYKILIKICEVKK